ncbi:MAG: Asp-tRNA(Asn)/Glu-tRNA(Gln) amidotransferase subunit GatC [Anaerolineales bacterium]
MKEKITPEVFQRLVDLAALELSEEEAEVLRRELNNQLVSIEVLEGIDIDEEVEAASHGVPYPPERSPEPRKDEVIPDPHREEILDQAPEREDGYYVVPDISHEELE